MIRKSLFACLALGGLLLSGCGGSLALKGVVLLPDDSPAGAANVRTEPQSEEVPTALDGSFVISKNLVKGKYNIIATYDDYEGRIDNVIVPSDTLFNIIIGVDKVFEPEVGGGVREIGQSSGKRRTGN